MKTIIAAMHNNNHPEKNAGIATFSSALIPDARLGYNVFTRLFPQVTQLVHRSAMRCLCHPHEVLSPLTETEAARTDAKATFTITVRLQRDDTRPRTFTFILIRNTLPTNPRAWLLSRIDYVIHNTS